MLLRNANVPQMRLVILLLALVQAVALAPRAFASPFLDTASLQAKGWGSRESTVNGDLWGGMGGMAVDPTDEDAAYYYDGLAIRRHDFGDGTDVTVFAPPPPAGYGAYGGGPFGAFIVFDPDNDNAMFFAESSDATITRITLSASNRATATANAVIYTAPAFHYPFAATFDDSVTPARMVLSESGGWGMPNEIVLLDRSTTPAGRTKIGEVDGYSGGVSFAPDGDLYYVYPIGYGPNAQADENELVRWASADVAAAIGDPTNTPLAVTNLASERTVSGGYSSLLAREEAGNVILYSGDLNTGRISRLDITQPANDDLTWAVTGVPNNGSSFTLSPGVLSTTSRTVDFTADAGQAATARIFVGYSYWVPAAVGETRAAIAQIVPNNTAAAIDSIVVVSQPTEISVDRDFTIAFELLDSLGNRLTTGDAATDSGVTFTFNGAGTLGNPASFGLGSSVSAGLITLAGFTVDTAQNNFTIDFTHTSSGQGVTSTAADANPKGEALAIVTAPATGLTGAAFDVIVEILDGSGARVTQGSDASVSVTIAVDSGTGTLGGTLTATAAAGVTTLTGLTYNTAETSVTLTVSATGMTDATTSAIDFTPGLASLSYLGPLYAVRPGAAFSISAELLDDAGARITTGADASAQITVTIPAANGTLSGTTTVSADTGVVQFDDLRFDDAGIYTLRIAGTSGVQADLGPIFVGYLSKVTKTEEAACALRSSNGWSSLTAMFAALLAASVCAARAAARRRRHAH